MPNNLAKFAETAGRIFGSLYAAFPIPTTLRLDPAGAARQQVPPVRLSDATPEDCSDEQFFALVAQWLHSEGYIKASKDAFDFDIAAIHEARLTEKGLRSLSVIPRSQNGVYFDPVGRYIVKALQTGDTEKLVDFTTTVLDLNI